MPVTPLHLMDREMLGDAMRGAMMTPPPLQFFWPEPGERDPWGDTIYFAKEPYDDGGASALAAYRWGGCF